MDQKLTSNHKKEKECVKNTCPKNSKISHGILSFEENKFSITLSIGKRKTIVT